MKLEHFAFVTALAVTSATVSLPVMAQRVGTSGGDERFCPGNYVQNGKFESILPGQPINQGDVMDSAQSWGRIAYPPIPPFNFGPSIGADLFGPNIVPQYVNSLGLGSPPVIVPYAGMGAELPQQNSWHSPAPATGNYAGMWMSNRIPAAQSVTRKAMLNRLRLPITRNSGNYVVNVNTAALSTPSGDAPTFVGIYGIKTGVSTPQISNWSNNISMNNPANLALFGPNNVVLLGTFTVPSADDHNWRQKVIQFNSSHMDPVNSIDRIFITKLDNAQPATQLRYVAFDDFCLQHRT